MSNPNGMDDLLEDEGIDTNTLLLPSRMHTYPFYVRYLLNILGWIATYWTTIIRRGAIPFTLFLGVYTHPGSLSVLEAVIPILRTIDPNLPLEITQ